MREESVSAFLVTYCRRSVTLPYELVHARPVWRSASGSGYRSGPGAIRKGDPGTRLDNLELFAGEALFPLCRQASLPGGGKPDILALDSVGRVWVIEVKRDVDRYQLSQALEYARWARSTNLDELAALYPSGVTAFFTSG